MFLIGFSHINIAPETVAIEDKTSIGVLIFFSSFMKIHDIVCVGDKIVAIEKRIE